MSFVILIALYLLCRLGVRILLKEGDRPFRLVTRTKDFVHVVSTLVFLMASFTLLGFEPGGAAATLEIHLKKERAEYGLLQSEIENSLAGAAISRVYDSAAEALASGGSIKGLVSASIDEGVRLRDAYASAQEKQGKIRDYRV
jgi:hypothetical protein